MHPQVAHVMPGQAYLAKAKRRGGCLEVPLVARHQRDALGPENRMRHFIAMTLAKNRLGIKGVNVRRSSAHEEVDDIAGFRGKMRTCRPSSWGRGVRGEGPRLAGSVGFDQ